MRGKGSRYLGLAGRGKDQESDEKKEGGEGERRDREIAETVPGDPVDAATSSGKQTRLRLYDHSALDEHVVDRGAGTDDWEREQVARGSVVTTSGDQQREDRQRVHQDPLEPAELAGDGTPDLRVEEAASGRDCGDDEGSPQLVAP